MNGTDDAPLDLFVVGGGINGAGIACDAVGRALTVGLCEMNDFASATSSASTKLIHGGLRYLEQYEFRLVREALQEREVLLAKAPHLSRPLRFVLPHEPHLRPRWMLRIGLFLYDHLDWHMTLPKSIAVDLPQSRFGAGLKPSFKKGFVYSDAWVDDARLVICNVKSARQMGARIYARHRCVSARRSENGRLWDIELAGPDGARVASARARPGQRHRTLGEALPRRADPHQDDQARAADQGQPHHRAAPARGRPRLHPAEQRPPHRLHHPLRARLLLHRHHRHPGRGGRDAGLHARGDRLSVRDRQPLHGEIR